MKIKYPHGGVWHEYDTLELKKTPMGRNIYDFYYEQYLPNPLSFFLPHGVPWASGVRHVGDTGHTYTKANYPAEWGNDGVAYVNDWEHDICMLVAPSKTGKSIQTVGKVGLYTCLTDESWHCFHHHNLKYVNFGGGKLFRVFSFSWDNVADLWKRYRELLPRDELGQYSPRWGSLEGEKGAQKNLSFGDGRPKEIVLQKSESVLSFNCYTQSDVHSEGFEADGADFDEQADAKTWNGFLRGCQTRGDYTPAWFAMTPRVMKGREADTGAAGFIKRELWDGANTAGLTIAKYHLSIDSTPDAIITPKKKRASYHKWADPKVDRSEHDARAGLARHWGIWEVGGGSVIDNYFPQHHLIPARALDMNHKIVGDATKYRGMDHGLNRPMACVWGMVFPWGQLLIYREYYQERKTIPYHARQIIELSGNTHKRRQDWEDPDTGEVFKTFAEECVAEHYESSVMDSRSFASPSSESARTMGEVYQAWGLDDLAPAKGYKNEIIVPDMKVWFDLNEKEPHLMHNFWLRNMIDEALYKEWLNGRKGVWWNGPKIYFLTSLRKTREEMVLWVNDPKTGKPKSDHDHIPGGALKYMLAEGEDLRYWGNRWKGDGGDGSDPWGERDQEPDAEAQQDESWTGRSFVPR